MDNFKSAPFSQEDKNLDILEFWQKHSKAYPRLYKISEFVLIIAATNNASERSFNITGLTLSKRRCSLGKDKLRQLMILRSNYDLLGNRFESYGKLLEEVSE